MNQNLMINNVLAWERRLEIDDQKRKNHQSTSYLETEMASRSIGDNRFELEPKITMPIRVPQTHYLWFPKNTYQDVDVS